VFSHRPSLNCYVMTSSALPSAVLWDMDGTLIDTEPYWMAAEADLASRFGIPWTYDDGLQLVGNSLDTSAQVFIDRGVCLEAKEITSTMIAQVATRTREHMPWLQDSRMLLDELVAAGVPCALVTASIGVLVDTFVDAAGDVFAAVVTGDQVRNGKPDPEPYLTAAQRLGVDPRQCVAIEDSPAGVRSAHASGAVTLAVQRHVPLPFVPGVSRLTSLDGVGIDGLARFFAGYVQDDFATS
jgi:beta-phosphoglucomutase-like phosphatase (HAD superfamily)